MNPYLWSILISILFLGSLAAGLSMVKGKAGLFSVAHAVFFGIGAYATAILMVRHDWSWAATILPGMVVASLTAVLIALVSLRLHEEYLIVGSLGMAIIGENVFLNLVPLTGGLEGIYGIPRPEVFGWHVTTRSDFALFAGILCAITLTFLWALIRSPYGRTLVALRDDDIAARALGKNTLVYKVSIFGITGALAGLIGSGYASYIQFVNPDDFTIHLAIVLVAMVLVGGMGTVKGAMVGAVLLVAIPESLRMITMPPTMVGVAQKALYGLVLVLFALLRPQGLFPDRGASLQLAPGHGGRRPRGTTPMEAPPERAEDPSAAAITGDSQ